MNRAPSHPGALLREMILPEAGLSVTALATRCGVARNTLSRIVNERADVTEDMAIRLSRALGSTPRFWLEMQNRLNLWKLQRERANDYKKIRPIRAA